MEMKANSKKPVIFSWQVTEIKPIKTSEEFKEWETQMQQNVGLKINADSIAMGSASTSCCPNADDCDVHQL